MEYPAGQNQTTVSFALLTYPFLLNAHKQRNLGFLDRFYKNAIKSKPLNFLYHK